MSIQLLINALIYASMLMLMAEAHTLTYLTADTFNFTVGPMAAIGAYVGFTWAKILGLQLYLGLPVAFTVCGLVGFLCCVLVVEPLLRRGRGPVLLTLALIGAGILFTGLTKIYADRLMHAYSIWTNTFFLREYDFAVGWVPGVFIVSTILALASVLLLEHLLHGSLFGASLRAMVEDVELAMVQGVNPARVRWVSWTLAGGLAGLAGAYGSIWFKSTLEMGPVLMTGVLASCLLGGVRSLRGAAVGGLLMGVVEITLIVWGNQMVGVWVGEYRQLVPIAVIALSMYFKPQGLIDNKCVPASGARTRGVLP